MIDHISLGVSDLAHAKEFYDKILGALGYACHHTIDIPGRGIVAHGYSNGQPGPMAFWIGTPEQCDKNASRKGGTHVAFQASSRKAVDEFYRLALQKGGTDNGPPGPRPHYHPDYYGAFVFDPDGNKIEACCHLPE